MASDTIMAMPLSIGVLSKRTGCNIETIRYYERIGILPNPPRSGGGHRVYAQMHLKRLTFVKRSRELGFSLKQIRELLGLVDGGDYACADVKALTLAQLDNIRTKIADLRVLDSVLSDMAAQCEGGEVPDCPIVDALFQDQPSSQP